MPSSLANEVPPAGVSSSSDLPEAASAPPKSSAVMWGRASAYAISSSCSSSDSFETFAPASEKSDEAILSAFALPHPQTMTLSPSGDGALGPNMGCTLVTLSPWVAALLRVPEA
jgi:hypothetical protein